MNLPSPDDLIETFAFLPDWESRYAYLIDLGRALPEMDVALQTDAVLVTGCTSRVWVVGEKIECRPGEGRDLDPSTLTSRGQGLCRDDNCLYHFHISSDAAIVKGLCAVVMVFVQDKTAEEIRAVDMVAVFEKLHLAGNLSPNRRNGFFAMVERIKQLTR